MSNDEKPGFKIGLIGEYITKIRLNEYGINTGSVDKDTGTDIVMFRGGRILTAQVKTGRNAWNCGASHNVNVHFMVRLNWPDGNLSLDGAEICWQRLDIHGDEWKPLEPDSVGEMFQ
jgi:hypothetical protein